MRPANARMDAKSLPAQNGLRTAVLAALFFAVSELAVALAHGVLVPRTTLLILFGLEFGLALVISAVALVAIVVLACLLRSKADEAGLAALRTAGPLLAMPLFYSFYVLNTKGLARLPFSGFERLFFNGLFVLLAAAAVAVAAASFKRRSGQARGFPFWAGCFFLQLVLPAVHFFFLSSVPNPSTPTARLVFLLLMTAPLAGAAWLAARVAAGVKRRGISLPGAAGLILVPLLLLAFVPPLANYRQQPSSPRSRMASGTVPRPNVVFVVWDTGRKDRCSLYGHVRPTTPRLAELAADGAAFQNALTVSPWTLPSHASMFTGLYPSQHGADNTEGQRRFGRPLAPDALTLAEILRAEGYRTAALTANHGIMNTRSAWLRDSTSISTNGRTSTTSSPSTSWPKSTRTFSKTADQLLLSLDRTQPPDLLVARYKPRPAFLSLPQLHGPHGADYLPPPARSLFGGGSRPPDALCGH
jgi:hypothetical protein